MLTLKCTPLSETLANGYWRFGFRPYICRIEVMQQSEFLDRLGLANQVTTEHFACFAG